ncbi:hypothetical protein OG885_09505 [Streptomyces sp. NBC_00028]|uniref:LVIVD repeat-containing protein n=1 Tax=Streptomyces sp. NBC_00028 TaxID=2975624 RepID=UPI00325142B9
MFTSAAILATLLAVGSTAAAIPKSFASPKNAAAAGRPGHTNRLPEGDPPYGRGVHRRRSFPWRHRVMVFAVVASGAALVIPSSSAVSADTGEGVAKRANCGPGSLPETGVQGQVPLKDRESGRSKQGYRCNLERLGGYQGEGATYVNPSYKNCAYMGTSLGGVLGKKSQGTQVVDVSDPANPKLTANLTSPAMLTGTWETLKVNEKRGLLAAVSAGAGVGGLFFDVYDISQDCAHPRLLNSFANSSFTLPTNVLGHEGGWAPDGRTYYASGLVAGSLTAIDVTDPTRPRIVFTGAAGIPANHGFSLSTDGNRMYIARVAPAGVDVIDTSQIQSRRLLPMIRQLGHVSWSDGLITQHTISITHQGKPYLVAVDEFGAGGVKFIDLSDERQPKVTDRLRLEIQTPQHVDERRADTTGNGLFGYEAHYCSVNRPDEPTMMACSEFQSGVRVFDIRDFSTPQEVAYYNPPAQPDKRDELKGSEHASGLFTGALSGLVLSDITNYDIGYASLEPANLSTDWCTSPPRFVGEDQLWVTCQDTGFNVLRFTNGVHND